jgi:hypothetical protein
LPDRFGGESREQRRWWSNDSEKGERDSEREREREREKRERGRGDTKSAAWQTEAGGLHARWKSGTEHITLQGATHHAEG